MKLEKEYLSLQQKALNAPGASLGELRQLRDEVFALRREKALAEQKEAEVRRELSLLREQVGGFGVLSLSRKTLAGNPEPARGGGGGVNLTI